MIAVVVLTTATLAIIACVVWIQPRTRRYVAEAQCELHRRRRDRELNQFKQDVRDRGRRMRRELRHDFDRLDEP